ncbi:MAG: DUF4249 domain-containing protein [Flavobacteriaceae bacterium]|nr:DUF4249 domain-containing protein [Flavobacteriaceae bacterium]
MSMNKILLSAIVALTISACTKNAGNVKLPKTEKLLVVQCILSPYDVRTTVSVDWSQDYFNNPNQNPISAVAKCVVLIASNDTTFTLTEKQAGVYSIDTTTMKVIPGQTYNLYVKEPGGKEARAVCTVPVISKSSLNFVSMDSQIVKIRGQEEKSFFMKCRLDDDGATKDFYTIYPVCYYGVWEYEYNQFGAIIDSSWTEQTQETYLDIEQKYVNDQDFNGQKKNMTFTFQDPNRWGGPGGPSPTVSRYDTLELLTIQCDEAYFKYHRSVESFSQNEGNPFAEPTFIYSNITGGIGIFAAYIQKRVLVKL